MIKKLYLATIFSLLLNVAFAQKAVLKGNITDKKTNEPVIGAVVHFDDYKNAVSTNEKGEYTLPNVVPGEYKVKVKYIGYKEFEQKLTLGNGQVLVLNIQLEQKNENLQVVNVFGKLDKESDEASRASEKNADNVVNVVGAKAIVKSPDINAANVLQRVSSVTIQRNSGGDDAYAVIRGMEPRYNNTLINDVKIASPDDKSRFVSLNVVPSDILQRIEVSKTLTPEMEGDAIGGTVNMVFKNAPDSLIFNASASIGYSAIFLDRKFVDFSKKDIQQESFYDKYGPTYTPLPGDFSRSNLDFKQITAPPNTLFGFTLGKRFLDNKLGLLVSDNFQSQYYGNNSELNPVAEDPNNHFQNYITDLETRTFSNHQINNGLVAHADYVINDRNKISADNVFLYTYFAQAYLSTDTTIVGGDDPRTIFMGKSVPGTGAIHQDNTSSINEQYLENFKLNGKHILSRHFLIDWTGVFSYASNKSPDRADYTTNKKISYVDTAVNKFVSTPYYYDGGTRIWQQNQDKDFDGLLNLTYKTKMGKNPLELKFGGLYRHKERDNYQNEYVLSPQGGTDTIHSRQVFTNIYNTQDIVLNPNGTAMYDLNNYHAYENIIAGYGEFKLVINKLDLVGGVRVENTTQGYHFTEFELDAPNNVSKVYTDILPDINLKYRLSEKTNIRAAYFMSIARPGYYEVIPVAQPFGSSAEHEQGNSQLLHTTANNFDLRYEFFPKPDQQLFIGGFYKKLINPIELAFVDADTYEPVNAPDATVYGAEIIYTKFFGQIGITGNYSHTYSNVAGSYINPSTGHTVLKNRPLENQANDELNLSVEYKNDKKKLFIQLAFQYTGKTLYRIDQDLGDDYYLQPQAFLSLSADKALAKHFILFGKFNNLLNTATIIKTGPIVNGHDLTQPSGLVGIRYSY